MTILGIIAATMVTTLKPSQYKQQGFDTLKKRTYSEIDGVMQTFLVECCKDMDSYKVYKNCDRTQDTHAFGNDFESTGQGYHDAQLFSRYMRGAVASGTNVANGSCSAIQFYTSIRLKNGVCVYFGPGAIKVDVNGNQGPNETGSDQFFTSVGTDGLSKSLDEI